MHCARNGACHGAPLNLHSTFVTYWGRMTAIRQLRFPDRTTTSEFRMGLRPTHGNENATDAHSLILNRLQSVFRRSSRLNQRSFPDAGCLARSNPDKLSCMSRFLILLVAGLLFCPGPALGQKIASFGKSDQAAIEQLLDRYSRAYSTKDYAALREQVVWNMEALRHSGSESGRIREGILSFRCLGRLGKRLSSSTTPTTGPNLSTNSCSAI